MMRRASSLPCGFTARTQEGLASRTRTEEARL